MTRVEEITIVEKSLTFHSDKYDKEIQRMQNNKKMQKEYISKVRNQMPQVILALEKEHLMIQRMSVMKTGLVSDWEQGDYMKVELNLIPTSGKIKFIKFDGYKKNGEGRNQSKLVKKSVDLENRIKESTGLKSVHVNLYSFEDNSTSRNFKQKYPNSILMDLWVH